MPHAGFPWSLGFHCCYFVLLLILYSHLDRSTRHCIRRLPSLPPTLCFLVCFTVALWQHWRSSSRTFPCHLTILRFVSSVDGILTE